LDNLKSLWGGAGLTKGRRNRGKRTPKVWWGGGGRGEKNGSGPYGGGKKRPIFRKKVTTLFGVWKC